MTDVEITPEHTYARAEQVLKELDDLRQEMGRFKDVRAAMEVKDASPREVFHHAQTVHRKANQLCEELGLVSVKTPGAESSAHARASDVLRVLDGVRERIAAARGALHLEGDDWVAPPLPGPIPRVPGKTPSDTMLACLCASRQLNAMLLEPFGSREGHVQILRALALAEVMLAPHGRKLPTLPAFERRKRPQDVFGVLWGACETLYQMLRTSGVSALQITRGYAGEEPTDVHDLAAIIVSELEHVASLLGLSEPPQLSSTTLPVVQPVHNHRRARQLRSALELLADLAREKPEWLRAVAR